MSIDDNKQVVRDFLAHFRTAAIPELLAAMSEDATWWIIGQPQLFPGAGTKSKIAMDQLWRGLFSHMKNGLEMSVLGMVAEGDQVATEIRSYADLTSGKTYANQYHMLFTVRGGKIVAVKEYADTLLIKTMFG
jgi:ketosteroid isomerase-like protein